MADERVPSGTVHKLPTDLRQALTTDTPALDAWRHITPLARNEWICWVESANAVKRGIVGLTGPTSSLTEGKRRPCCWQGCSHRAKNGK